ncbi:uncharacterized protein LOC111133191 [Crassostrea virginica]|uniref:Mucin-5AC-like n=1 Tax=Crassostrea virginica TaxID=6565 RepID=A0A8B8EBI4_CRAVI|nr:mucin-5AC-like [Crassostrea virginica]
MSLEEFRGIMILNILLIIVFSVQAQNQVCNDKARNCADYGQRVCQPPYDTWGRQNCPLFCGFCTGTTFSPQTTLSSSPEPCVDKIRNCADYGQTICNNSSYTPWAARNCRYYCRHCSSEELSKADLKPASQDCKDKRSNCKEYGQRICEDPYKKWGQEYCPLFCGFCSDCKDKRSNCADYGKSICREPYNKWGREYCPLYCGFCQASATRPLNTTHTPSMSSLSTTSIPRQSTVPTPTTKATTTTQTTTTTPKPSTTKGFTTVPQSTTKVTTTTPTPTFITATSAARSTSPSISWSTPTSTAAVTTTCVDKRTDCIQYGQSICTIPDYSAWVLQNCRYFCRQCTDEQLAAVDAMTTTISPENCVDKVSCRNYSPTVCTQYHEWAMDNCALFCNFCKGKCVDKISNCNMYGRDACSKYRPWAEDNCSAYCQFCTGDSGNTTSAQP